MAVLGKLVDKTSIKMEDMGTEKGGLSRLKVWSNDVSEGSLRGTRDRPIDSPQILHIPGSFCSFLSFWTSARHKSHKSDTEKFNFLINC